MNHKLFCQPYFALTTLILGALFSGGCAGGSHPDAWNLSIAKATPASIQVDLIGVTAAEKPYWQGYNLDNYWTEGDRRRREADKLSKTLETGQPWLVSMTDPKWQEWFNRGDTELLVIANLPGTFDAGPSDPRRIFLPLNKHAWKARHHTIEIQVQDTLVLVNTPQTTP